MIDVSLIRDTFESRAILFHEDDVNTDRIMPSRYLKLLTFDELGEHVFAGDRANARAAGRLHAFDDPSNAEARILISGANFGAGSSREAAPQALQRWGIGIILAVSFGEIFYGNSAAIGLPCVRLEPEAYAQIARLVRADPSVQLRVSLTDMTVRAQGAEWPVHVNETHRNMFRTGTWDTLTMLHDALPQVRAVAAQLPYLNGWR